MANGPPSASWHPALMPDSHILPSAAAAAAATSSPKSPPIPAQQATPESIESLDERPQAILDPSLADESGTDDVDAWLVSDDAVAPASISTPTAQQSDAEPEQAKHESPLPEPRETALESDTALQQTERPPLVNEPVHEPDAVPKHEDIALQQPERPLLASESSQEPAAVPEHEEPPPDPKDAAVEKYTALQESERPPLASEQPFQTTASKECRRQSTHAQHSSSMSFARTVSHEVSFVDDDAEWNLARSNPDASEFLPQPDRSNSFPDVPPCAASHQGHSDQPLPSNQVLSVMEEAEKEAKIDEQLQSAESNQVAPETSPAQSEDKTELQRASQAIGGEAQGFEAQDFEARYEEGVPLVSNLDAPTSAAQDAGAGAFVDSFADDAADDDFFAQRQEPGVRADDSGPEAPSIERKSTTQAMGGLSPGSSFPPNPPGNTTNERAASQSAGSSNQSESWGVPGSSDVRNEDNKEQPAAQDVAAKWQEIFAEEEDGFLSDDEAAGEKPIDAAAFLGSDDEGLLDDDGLLDDAAGTVSEPQSTPALSNSRQHSMSSPYIPSVVTSPQQHVANASLPKYQYQRQPLPPFNSGRPQSQAAEPRPEQPRVSSFADKSNGGYSSPYDLPTDLLNTPLKPRKRSSLQQLPWEQPPPPRSSSVFAPGHPPPSKSLPPSTHPIQGPGPDQRVATPSSRNSSSFFEDLPVAARPAPRSRQGSTPRQQSPYVPTGQHSHSAPPPAGPLSPPANRAPPPPPGVGELVAPERVNPYAAISSPAASVTPPTGTTSRYPQASLQQPTSHASAPPAASSRYSPAPLGPRPSSSHSHGAPATPSQGALPHLPRTSSPLAHFEASSDKIQRRATASNGDAHHHDRRTNSFEHRLDRVSSLPPTREVEEEEDDQRSPAHRSFSSTQANRAANADSRSVPAPHPAAAHPMSPPSSRSYGSRVSLSLQRAWPNYVPQAAPAARPEFAPPPRPLTQSPVAAQNGRANPTDYYARPSSAHGSAAPVVPNPYQPLHPPTSRRRGQSLSMNMVPPTDGREHDPLQRWKGTPLLAWGVGGTIATSFPKSVPRYTMNQTAPTMLRTAGEVKVQNIKDVDPLADQLARFPGPLKGKSRKKEALAWLAAGIDAQEKDLPDISFHSQLSLGAKRVVERLLLWKLLRVFIEFDGALEGKSNVEKAVRDILAPETASLTPNDAALIPADAVGAGQGGPVTSMMADSADPATVEQIRLHLLRGNRETAVWSAVDKRLWGHAMLISHTVSPDLYKQVSQEFVRKEVNYPGHNNESIAALYKVLSGNFDDCVDELVPMHARVGLQLVSKQSALEPARDAADGLDKWRETLTLILNNRRSDDVRSLKALGKLFASYGRAEAAQICFIFSRSISVFGGLDDKNADFVLVGSDHRQQTEQFAKETEALQLSEVYEYGLSLAGGAAAAAGAPHLAAYNFQHAVTLAEYGYQDKALQYCDAIASAMVSQTRRSPYHHAILEAAVDDFMTRLKQAPKDASSSWMSKPSMNKVSDSMWNRFNKFVAGDEGEKVGNGAAGEGDHGPFARVVTTPNMSRSPSVSNFETYGAGSPVYGANPGPPLAPGASTAASRYAPAPMQPAALGKPFAPMSQYAPASASSDRNSNEYSRNAYEPVHPGSSHSPAFNNSAYAPAAFPVGGLGYQPGRPDFSAVSPNNHAHSSASVTSPMAGSQLSGHQQSPGVASQSEGTEENVFSPDRSYQPPTYGYQPPEMTAAPHDNQGKEEGAAGGYEPPWYQPHAYEPPSYQPGPEPSAENDGDAPRPKKSFMDDDDVPALRPETKSKTDKDRENEEMFHKAAEEDAKRAAAQQSAKKGWGFSGWFGGSKKAEANMGESSAPDKPVRAKLGEASSFVYDPELKRWINKKPGAENTEVKKATPPPPRAAPWSASGTPALSSSTPPPPVDRSSAPPLAGPMRSMPTLASKPSQDTLGLVAGPPMTRSDSSSGLPPSGPPSRPATSMSNASSIDDLLGAAPRKAGQKKACKSGRYVDVMAK